MIDHIHLQGKDIFILEGVGVVPSEIQKQAKIMNINRWGSKGT